MLHLFFHLDLISLLQSDVITPPYAQVLNELYSKQDVLAMALLTIFAEMFDLPTHTFTDMFRGKGSEGDFGTIRLLYYPGYFKRRLTP